jgi:hypothetical protein
VELKEGKKPVKQEGVPIKNIHHEGYVNCERKWKEVDPLMNVMEDMTEVLLGLRKSEADRKLFPSTTSGAGRFTLICCVIDILMIFFFKRCCKLNTKYFSLIIRECFAFSFFFPFTLLSNITKLKTVKFNIFFFWGGGIFFFLLVHYSVLLHLPPLRFHCADGCWE